MTLQRQFGAYPQVFRPLPNQLGGSDVGDAGSHQFAINHIAGVDASGHNPGYRVTQFMELAPLHQPQIDRCRYIAAFQRSLLNRIHKQAVRAYQDVVVHFPIAAQRRAGGNHGGAVRQPLPPAPRESAPMRWR